LLRLAQENELSPQGLLECSLFLLTPADFVRRDLLRPVRESELLAFASGLSLRHSSLDGSFRQDLLRSALENEFSPQYLELFLLNQDKHRHPATSDALKNELSGNLWQEEQPSMDDQHCPKDSFS
jgi:hypothetical protein